MVYAFVHISKTAGTTITYLLRRNFGLGHFDTGLLLTKKPMNAAQLRRVRILYPKLRSISGHHVRPFSDLHRECETIKYYTFLREPVRRVVSKFSFSAAHQLVRLGWRPETRQELEEFFLQIVGRSKNGMCLALSADGKSEGAIEALERDIKYVGIQERFDESLRGLKKWMDDVDFDIRYRSANVSKNKTAEVPKLKQYDAYYQKILEYADEVFQDPRMLDVISDTNRDDLTLYDHALKKRYSVQSARYGNGSEEVQRLEDNDIRKESLIGRVYRNVVARPIIPLLIVRR